MVNSICLKKKFFYFVNKHKKILLEPAATLVVANCYNVSNVSSIFYTTRRDLTEDGELLSEISVKRAFLLQKHKTLNQTELKILR